MTFYLISTFYLILTDFTWFWQILHDSDRFYIIWLFFTRIRQDHLHVKKSKIMWNSSYFFFMKKAKHDYDIYYLITTLFTRFRHDLPDIYRIHYSCNFLSISCKQCINCQNHVEIRYSVSILSFSCIKSIKVLETLKSSNTDSWIFWPFSISNKNRRHWI